MLGDAERRPCPCWKTFGSLLYLFFSSPFLFHLYFFLHGRKVSRREGGEEAQGILIFTLQREEPGFKDLMLGPSPSPRGPGHLVVRPRPSSCVSKGAEGLEGVGPSALHGEHWGAPSPAREMPPPQRVNAGHQHSGVSWALRSREFSSLQSFTQKYTEEGGFWQHRHCPWLAPRETGECLEKLELDPASK